MRKPILLSVLVLILAGTAGAALAGNDGRQRFNIDAPRDQWMSVAQIAEKYEAQGFKVRQVELDDGVYEIYAVNAQGLRLEAYVHPVTGEILAHDNDD